jgi:hypothetical protein
MNFSRKIIFSRKKALIFNSVNVAVNFIYISCENKKLLKCSTKLTLLVSKYVSVYIYIYIYIYICIYVYI